MELDALLHNVMGNPLDDQCRLVLADFLEEQDDVRSQLIRYQLQLADFPKYAPQRTTLRNKERRLFRQHGAFGSAPAKAKVTHHHGGFISGIELRVDDFLANADDIFANAPITHLTLRGAWKNLPQVAEVEGLRQIRHLEINTPKATATRLLPLLLSPHLSELRTLHIGSYQADPPDYLPPFVAETAATGLEEVLLYSYRGGYRICEILAGGDKIHRIKRVSAWCAAAEMDQEIEILATAPVFSEVEYVLWRGLHNHQLQRLGQSPIAARIKSFASFLSNLTRFPAAFPNLEELVISGGSNDALMADICEGCPGLKALEFRNGVTDSQAQILANSPLLENLRSLKLRHNQISTTGAQALGRSPYRRRGLKIYLDSNSITHPELLWDEFGNSFGNL